MPLLSSLNETNMAIEKSTVGKRDQSILRLTVPSLFRCPISMDVMKSPVSLCTGVTYDRASIQKWLSQGHNTCPATMQVLPSADVTPNLTLRRLITLYQQHASPAPPPLQDAVRIIRNIAAGEEEISSMRKVLEFVNYSDENRRSIAASNGAVSDLVEIMRKSEAMEVCEQIVVTFERILTQNGVKEVLNSKLLNDCLSKFVWILRNGSCVSRIASAKILEAIAYDGDSQRKIAEKEGLLYELYNLSCEETASDAVEASFSALVAVSASKSAKKDLIRYGIVRAAGKILSGSDPGRAVTEKALEILVSIATCTDGRSALGEDEVCVKAVVKRLMKCSGVATEHGITVLWSVCCLARDRTAQGAVTEVNGLTRVLLVMQSDCSPGVRKMCGELVKVLRGKSSKSCLASYETRTTHIMPY